VVLFSRKKTGEKKSKGRSVDPNKGKRGVFEAKKTALMGEKRFSLKASHKTKESARAQKTQGGVRGEHFKKDLLPA